MMIKYKILKLRPYPGTIYYFSDLEQMKAKYSHLKKEPYPYQDELTGGRYVRVDGKLHCDTVWLVYGKKPHVVAHEFTHVLLQVWNAIGAHPADGNGEPFCYMLSQLMLEAFH